MKLNAKPAMFVIAGSMIVRKSEDLIESSLSQPVHNSYVLCAFICSAGHGFKLPSLFKKIKLFRVVLAL